MGIAESKLTVEAVLPILNKIAIFGGLREEQLNRIFGMLAQRSCHEGEFIFEAGQSPKSIFIIQRGRVELLLPANGSYLAKAVFGEGDCFGETAVIGIQKHTASAMALEETDLIELPRSALFQIWEEDKELFGMLILNIAREACRRLNQTDETLLHYFADH
ncbi:MAG: cyclic nucleotide-binding domain-containing protein [Planctomycetota bacterium]|jgi:CRP-like cAMP-binding protein